MQPLHSWPYAIAALLKAFLSSMGHSLNPTPEQRPEAHGA
ncbi:hypothetical protein K788_0002061 (plasmid) [Paraburkholderia caribensis MBA4]|uniref:Uncharacterized protein n=1 Tax=Paraburkholderia caribensis MBA4 TaxID=1323664 RepID=A0A0P0RQ02_9BURK|nr:hypothetical protein K788_0002061 [Paraburkholderia caribensis MBA4]